MVERSPASGDQKEEKYEGRYLGRIVGLASVVLLGAMDSASAADEWFVLSEQVLQTANPSVDIKSEGNRWEKNVKQVKLSVEGADVDISKVVLNWDNSRDEVVWNVGTLKAGGQTATKDSPGRKGRLKAVKVQYRILNDAPTATLKVWVFD
jgi:hypothetical protein